MASVGDFVADVTPRECAELDKVLRPGEQVRWAVRPLCRYSPREMVDWVFGEIVAVGFLAAPCVLTYMLFVNPPSESLVLQLLMLAFFAIFFLLGVYWAAYPWREYRRRQRMLYLLTNHRALALAPGEVQAYPLHADMLQAHVCRPGGSGDLLFDGERGFTRLPDLLRAHRELNDAVAALLDAAEANKRVLSE